MSADKPTRLGRGLDALIPGSASASSARESELQRIPIAQILPNPFQPRRAFDPTELAELEASLTTNGLLQPITVRRHAGAYQLVAGERRLRAAAGIHWTDIPAVVREFDDRTMLVLALVENLQRANLNAVEEARGYRRLMDEFKLTQQAVADAVGKDRTTVTNLLRMLSLPEPVQTLVERGVLSAGHARALLALGPKHSASDVANQAVARGLSVRQLEHLVRELSGARSLLQLDKKASERSEAKVPRSADPAVRQIEDDLRRYLQTDVRMQVHGGSKGKLEIAFYSADDLDRILDLILRENRREL